MKAKSQSPTRPRSKSPLKSSKQYVDGRAKKLSEKQKKAHGQADEEPKSKKAMIIMCLFFIMFISSTVYSFFRSKSTEVEKPKRPQIADLDIPREVIERLQKLRNTQDREQVLTEWAESEGIKFENRKDGSEVAIREGKEYIMRPADPDFNPDVEAETEEPSEIPESPEVDEPEFGEDEIIEDDQ